MNQDKLLKLNLQHFATTTYNPKKVSAIIDGVFGTGFMDGTFISAEKNEDDVTPHVGAQGDVTFAESADNTGTITMTFKQSSSTLPYLRALRNEKRIFPIQVIDSNTNTRVGGNEARIVKMPNKEFAAEESGVEVQFYVADFTEN
ncbi:phage structural protein [Metabacillus litoralis]|uniref:phage structural protein n=1 Tax=Metabacillus litoralis TaxID=152268 RepID=UPI00203EE55B|nr:phage protein [Metabacillus litoralis]MCM3413521.1 DUF3277 family protein [Metabacillus litoralis]